ncbi:hypothetical protein [Mesorhizobium sp.]|uniref:hypothetical protein n=1 Tax=Mesorhizobium sp. TaxID=1871066 RepID=UPI000FE49028|nr:hypothetical protein [Mesorhizobium sp.]RWO55390.1 MAG: hypothetical protein EOS14_30095 [Mesorhizobium sp.]
MGRPLLGDKPLTAAEKVKRYRQKKRGIVEPTPQSSEPSAEELLKQARREISALRQANDRLRADAGLTARNTPADEVSAAVSAAPPQDASAPGPMVEEVEGGDSPPSIWAAVLRAERLRKAGKPL